MNVQKLESDIHVLVVEDHVAVARGIRAALKDVGYAVTLAHSVTEAMTAIASQAIQLVVLDLGLPDGDGIQLMKDIHDKVGRIPILILTARDSIEDRVIGLDAGAEDYLIKPFETPELLARLRRILRMESPRVSQLTCDNLRLDAVARTVVREARKIELSPKEFELLRFFMENKGRIVSRTMIAEEVWDAPSRHTPINNVIEVCICRLREKTDVAGETPLLLTIRGAGYMMREPE